MPFHRSVRMVAVLAALALLPGLAAPPPRAAAAEAEIKCANCGKSVKQSKAVKVIKNGQVYYVCSDRCAKEFKKK
jgi:hypothetical protein